eukprot:Hpha_TRINITY_DN3770_c0_g1::TRINITY_DN3770_c0_g1_i1::g.23778::m.23778
MTLATSPRDGLRYYNLWLFLRKHSHLCNLWTTGWSPRRWVYNPGLHCRDYWLLPIRSLGACRHRHHLHNPRAGGTSAISPFDPHLSSPSLLFAIRDLFESSIKYRNC